MESEILPYQPDMVQVNPPQIVRCRTCKAQCGAQFVKRNIGKHKLGRWEYSCLYCSDDAIQHRSQYSKVTS